MPSKKAYDLVSDDGYDTRIPLHNEEAFQHGLQFQAKYIGTLDVPRPSSRVEIVAAMRRIRYEFKAKAIKKKKIVMTISIEGVKVSMRKKKKSQLSIEESRCVIMSHPIYRIFYVSHDSQDLKIWSYIARDGPSNVFKCNVFKAYKKSQAMRIVRTIGQAFEVCHKLGGHSRPVSEVKEEGSPTDRTTCIANERKSIKDAGSPKHDTGSPSKDKEVKVKSKPTPPGDLNLKETHGRPRQMSTPSTPRSPDDNNSGDLSASSSSNDQSQLPLSQHHQMQLLRQQLEQQQHQTQVAIAQVHLLKDQLSAETAARIEAQARSHQLLLHNKDLLDHVSLLVSRVQNMELKLGGQLNTHHNDSIVDGSSQIPCLPDATTPRPAPVYLPNFPSPNQTFESNIVGGANLFANNKAAAALDTDSPDSGHKEMSSESLTYSLANDNGGWLNPYNDVIYTSPGDVSRLVDNMRGNWNRGSSHSSSPPSSTPSKSSTLKGGSNNSMDNSSSNRNSFCSTTSTSSRQSSFCSNNIQGAYNHHHHKYYNNNNNSNNNIGVYSPVAFRNDSYSTTSPNLYRSPSDNSNMTYHRKEASDRVKLISVPSSSSNSSSPPSSQNYYTAGELRSSSSMPMSISGVVSGNTPSPASYHQHPHHQHHHHHQQHHHHHPDSSHQPLPPPSSSGGVHSSSSSSSSLIGGVVIASPNMAATPKLDPPPKFRRTSRSIERWERGSWYGVPLPEGVEQTLSTDSDYFTAYANNTAGINSNTSSNNINNDTNNNGNIDSNTKNAVGSFHNHNNIVHNSSPNASHAYNLKSHASPSNNSTGNSPNTGVILRCHTRNSGNGTGCVATAGVFRYSDSSARSSTYSEGRDSMSSMEGYRSSVDRRVNDLNSDRHSLNARLSAASDNSSDNCLSTNENISLSLQSY